MLKLIRNNLDWKNVIFSDEKHFNLEQPDGFNCYWHNHRKAKDSRQSRHFQGKSLILWGTISANGKKNSIIVSSNMNSEMNVKS